jgi:hypothetical protein
MLGGLRELDEDELACAAVLLIQFQYRVGCCATASEKIKDN